MADHAPAGRAGRQRGWRRWWDGSRLLRQHTCRHSSSGASAGVGPHDDSPAHFGMAGHSHPLIRRPLLHSRHTKHIVPQVTDNLSSPRTAEIRDERNCFAECRSVLSMETGECVCTRRGNRGRGTAAAAAAPAFSLTAARHSLVQTGSRLRTCGPLNSPIPSILSLKNNPNCFPIVST